MRRQCPASPWRRRVLRRSGQAARQEEPPRLPRFARTGLRQPEPGHRAKLAPRPRQALETPGLGLIRAGARRSSAYHRDPGRSARRYPALSPRRRECAFGPFDVLSRRLTMLFDQVSQQRPQGLAFLVFRQNLGNVTRNRIRPSGANFPVDSRELIRWQADRDLRPGHTTIIPLKTV
jgi:hypothetical protein